MWGIRKTVGEPLVVSMAGVKLGERVLLLGTADRTLLAGVGTKSGLTGRTCVFGESPEQTASAVRAAEAAGALVEGTSGPWSALPFDDGSFDVALVRDVLPGLMADGRQGALREVWRVLRPGGRVVVIDSLAGTGPLGRLRPRPAARRFYGEQRGAAGALEIAGFKAVRPLADRDGLIFTEGARPATR